MRRLLAILALVAFMPGALWAQSINQSKTDVSTLIKVSFDASLGTGLWMKTVNGCSSFRAVFDQSNATTGVQFELHALPDSATTPSANTLIQTFTAAVAEPGLALNATNQYFMFNITRAESDSKSFLTIRCSNAQAI